MAEYKINPKVGDRLYIPAGRYRPERWVIVVKVARIKFEVIGEDRHQDYLDGKIPSHVPSVWRKDTACEDGWTFGSAPTIYTPEQWALHQRGEQAGDYLRKLGIEVWKLNRETLTPLTLANLIRTHLGEEEI